MKRIAWLGLCYLFLAVTALASTPAPPPEPPFGWEDRVAPGYSPSVESVVLAWRSWDPTWREKLASVWSGWDEGAVDVLAGLLTDPAWSDFRNGAANVLVASPHTKAHTWIDRTLKNLAGAAELPQDDIALFHLLTSVIPAEERETYTDEVLKQRQQPLKTWAIGTLLNDRTRESLERALKLIEEEADGAAKSRWENWLDQTRGYIRAQEPMEDTL